MKLDKTTKQLAELVYNEGEIIDRTAFVFEGAHKVSYVMAYNNYRYYITVTNGEITYFHQSSRIFKGGKGYVE